jgi:hypothetical protein
VKAAALLAVALAALAAASTPARAQKPPARAGSAETTKLDEAQRRFQRGVELYKEGDFAGALVEFKRAYDLVPTYKILYNLGQVSYQRHDYAGAVRYFRQYLGDADDAITPERQKEVATEVNRLSSRVGSLEIQAFDDGADVLVDDMLMGTTPTELLIVNGGRRKVDLVARGGEHATRMVDVAGGEVVRVSFPRLVPQRQPPAAPAPAPVEPVSPHRTAEVTVTPWPVAAAAVPVVAAPAPMPATSVPLVESTPSAPPPPKAGFPWKVWTATGLLAAGAATTGVLAVLNKRQLDTELAKFPLDPVEVDYYDRRTRGFALATDGLLIGTSIMTAISFYLTFRSH